MFTISPYLKVFKRKDKKSKPSFLLRVTSKIVILKTYCEKTQMMSPSVNSYGNPPEGENGIIAVLCIITAVSDNGTENFNKNKVLNYLTNKYPGTVFVNIVPRNIFVHSQRGLTIIQLIDQLHFSQWTKKRKQSLDH